MQEPPFNLPKVREDAPFYDVQSGKLVQPNELRCQFLVAKPDVAWSLDIISIYNNKSGRKERYMDVLLVVDLGDGRVVAHFCASSITASDVTRTLIPELRVREASYVNQHSLLIHSDRGGQFVSNAYNNLMVLFPFVVLSHSQAGQPTDNAVSERVQRTIFRNNRFWQAAGHANYEKLVFNSADECRRAVDIVVNEYNSNFACDRSLGLTPNNAHWAFRWAAEKGLKEPEVLLTWNDSGDESNIVHVAYDEITTYRAFVRDLARRDLINPPASLAEATERSLVSQKLALEAEQLKQTRATQQQLEEINAKLEQLALAQPTKGKKRKKPANPRAPRTAFNQAILLEFLAWSTDVKNTVVARRDALCCALLYGVGSRASEISYFTFADAAELLERRTVTIYNSKRGRKELKAIAVALIPAIRALFNELVDILEQTSYNVTKDSFVFSDYSKKISLPLNEDYYLESLNKHLAEFSEFYNAKHGTQGYFRSHSGRIGFVTTLRKAGVDLGTTSKLVGHESVRSTQSYDRYMLSEEERLATIDKAFDKDATTEP